MLRDMAFKAVGVGSVGTFCAIGLFMSHDGAPLFIQIKEAGRSVLECLDQNSAVILASGSWKVSVPCKRRATFFWDGQKTPPLLDIFTCAN